MKPILVEFQAFGPYEKNESVDFEKMTKDGLFLIDGKTGSGKTMILDAITFALYGKSSGSNRDSLEQLRCSHCDPKDDTYVRFTFEEKGTRYVFERRLGLARKNLHESFSCLKINAKGNSEPIFENCKSKDMNKKAEELIGLSFDQFRQVIILPQGKFEKLLTSDSQDKEAILTQIFNSGKWQKLADKFFEKAKAKSDEINGIKQNIDISLNEEGCKDLSELNRKAENLKAEMQKEEDAFHKADYSNKKKKLNEEKALANDFNTLTSYKKQLKELNDKENDIKLKEKELETAEKAENLRKPLENYDNALNSLNVREKDKLKSEADLNRAKETLSDIQASVEAHKKNNKEYEDNKILKTSLELKKEAYESIHGYEEEYQKAQKHQAALKQAEEILNKAFNDAVDVWNKAAADLNSAEDHERAIRDSYMSGIKGHIAKELEEGVPCPVCGNIHHPKPAVIPGGSADEKDLEKAEKDTEVKKTAWDKAEKDRSDANNALTSKIAEVAAATTLVEKTYQNVETAKKALVKGIDNLEAYEKEMKRLDAEIKKYEKADEDLTKRFEKAEKDYIAAVEVDKAAEAELKKAGDEVEKDKNTLRDAISNTSFKSEQEARDAMLDAKDIKGLRDGIKEHYTKLEEYKKLSRELAEKLTGKSEPDSAAIDKELKDIEDAETEYNTQHGKKLEQHKRLCEKYANLSKDFSVYEKELPSAESNFKFAKLLRGDTGVGLQRYVLGIMFSSVIKAANEMLKSVAGGRYSLFRTSEKSDGGNKRGLDLKVMDSYGGSKDGRSVSTLSGGEKFLASLALSIGLAGIAKTGGVDIEGIFIDEGFGTLDEDCIGDALDILNSVKAANGLVGIISHVELLRNTIYPQVQVTVDDKKASHITMIR